METKKREDFEEILHAMGVTSYDPLVISALEEYSRS